MLSFIHNSCGLRIENMAQPTMPTTILQDTFDIHPTSRNIYIQVEPQAIFPAEHIIIKNSSKYSHILTFNDTILQQCPNAHKYLFGMTRILKSDYESIDITLKKFMLTSVTNDKLSTNGHYFRHTVYYNQHHITSIPVRFHRSTDSKNLPEIVNIPRLGSANHCKIDLFRDSQFSLVIENSRQLNYFTEKLCDCVITKTIPVYYGCPNISEYFDTTGWIILENENMSDMIEQLKTLTPDYYMKYIDTVNKNFEEVQEYIDIEKNINRCLRTIPDY
jgi:hypothetical protein